MQLTFAADSICFPMGAHVRLLEMSQWRSGCVRSVCRLLAATACLSALCLPLLALEPTTPLGTLGWQNWTIENGLPQNTVTALYQSAEGFLWAGTELGLTRFDGSSFLLLNPSTTAHFPDAEVQALLAFPVQDHASDLQGLWIGTSDGLVRWRDGKATRFGAREGVAEAPIRGLAATADGVLWVWAGSGIASSQDGRVFRSDGPPVPVGSVTAMVARGDALWITTPKALWQWRGGGWREVLRSSSPPMVAAASEAPGTLLAADSSAVWSVAGDKATEIASLAKWPGEGAQRLAELSDGTIAVAGSDGMVLLRRGAAGPGKNHSHVLARYRCGAELPGTRIETIFADREGALWIGSNHGLARWFRGKLERMPEANAIAREAIRSILEDREGSIWLGTEAGGLYILRDTRFHFLDESDGLSAADTTAIVEGADRTLWVGTREAGVNEIAETQAARSHLLTTANGLPSNVILALAAAQDGSIWVGTPDGLSHLRGHRLTTITAADNLPDDFIRSLYVARNRMVWIGTRHGLSCLDPTQADHPGLTWTTTNGLGSDLIGAMMETASGTLWVATLDGLAKLRTAPSGCNIEGPVRSFTTADGLSGDVITALAGDGERLWIGTRGHGITLWNGERFFAVPSVAARQLPETIHGLTVDESGWLWITSEDGIYRVNAAKLAGLVSMERNEAEHSAAVQALTVDHFTTRDGLRSRETSSDSHPTILRSGDGRIWFTTPRGVVYLDPAHFRPLPPPPPVVVERFTVDDLPQAIHGNLPDKIAAGHLRFEFDYVGLSFAMPQRVQYAYKLEGFDRNWTEAGTRRTAYYTNIPQGRYRFRVRAYLGEPGNGHPWTETEIAFVLRPHFYQTVWFYLLLAALVACAVLLIVRWRLYLARRRFDAVMMERNRIAREIHDTLAQGYVGVSVQLEVLGELLRRQRMEAAGSQLQRLQQLVRDGLEDARRSIWALRSQDASEQTLPVQLRRLVEKTARAELHATVDIHGATRRLEPKVEEELLRIAREAILNVEKHTQAEHLALRLEYDERTVVLTVTDDGVGFPFTLHTTAAESPTGHYGLTGMRERAEVIGAMMEIASQPGSGTTVRITVPTSGARMEAGSES